ncbi:MAG: rhomboid family intramembrane serine protease, partial [Spirochaetaceae bacterium]|nr:rhomboid family intramembrane serine protease [Spirochaetaceae bacterium]
MRLKYNAPTVLTFTFMSALVLILSHTVLPSLTEQWFMVSGKGGFVPSRIHSWVVLISHVLGHASWSHLIGNFSVILLIGPILEERYGSLVLLEMILLTALVTGALNVLLFTPSLLGASGVAFMMILLASFTN